MRRILLASAAVVLTATTFTGASAAVPGMDWSGFYLGAHVGYTWGSTNVNIPLYPSNFNISTDSISGGLHIGNNWQLNDWLVVGVEGDGDALDAGASHLSGGGGGELYRVRYDWRASLRGRVGIASGDMLFYATGGWAWTNLTSAMFIPPGPSGSRFGVANGYTVGGGVEYKWYPNWIVGAEYLHDEMNRQAFVYGGPVSQQLTDDTIRLRISYKLGEEAPPPPMAPPPPAPPAPPPPVKTFIVFFDFDKSNLTDKAQEVVAEAVRTAKANGFVRVLVTGHTDTVGSDAYNQALSIRRAASVKDEMIREGLDGGGIEIAGKSFHDPLVPTGPGVREPQNRRAVIDLGG